MPLAQPRESTIAVIGDGLGSALVQSTAIYLGFAPEQVTVYGPADRPWTRYQHDATGLGQSLLRSASASQFLPADWPTFAELDAWSRRSPRPLLHALLHPGNPDVPGVMAQLSAV